MVLVNNKTSLDVIKNERSYTLVCDPNSPLGEVFDVLEEMKAHILKLMTSKKEEEESPQESEE